MLKRVKKKIVALVFYAIAMAYVEAMVVVYLRRLVPIEVWQQVTSYRELTSLIHNAGIMWSEQTREFATLVMLVSVAYLFGRNKKERCAIFLITFGIWDIFYYGFLYLWLRWPPHLLALDVLFLIPLPWLAPVVVPIIISIMFIIWGGIMLIGRERIKDESF